MAALSEDVTRRLRELETLYESLRTVTSTLDLAEIVRNVLATIAAVTSSEAFSLMLHDAERGELVFVASEMLSEETLVGGVAASGAIAAVTDPQRLAVGLRRDDAEIGLLEVRDRPDGRPFDEDDRARLEAVAAELVPTLAPSVAQDGAALAAAFARVEIAVPSRTRALVLRDEQGRDLVFTSSHVLRAGIVDGVRQPLDRGIAGWVARHRTSLCLDDAAADPRHDPTIARKTGLVPRTMICVPLVHRDALL